MDRLPTAEDHVGAVLMSRTTHEKRRLRWRMSLVCDSHPAEASDAMTTFNSELWAAAANGVLASSMRDLVRDTFERNHEMLTVATVIADGCNPGEVLARIGAPWVSGFGWAGPTAVLRLRDDDAAETLSVWPTDEEDIYQLVGTVPVTDERWRRLERWLAGAAPRVVPFVLNQADFEGIGAALGAHGEVEVSRLTARVLSDGSSYTRGWAEGRRSPRPTYSQALAEVDGFASVRTLTVHVRDRLSLHLRRQGGATFYGGDFDLFEKFVLNGIVQAAAQRRELLSGRERQQNVDPTHAIVVAMPAKTFVNRTFISELLDVISGQRGVGIAVLHSNPYLHIAVTDYLDGSNFDAFVTSDDKVEIFPGYRATLGALTRLTENIAERFAALEVADIPSSAPPTLEELFTTG